MLVLQALTDAFLDDPSVRRVDSLATAGHPLADRMWRERRSIGSILIPTGKRDAQFRLAVADAKIHLRARRMAAHAVRAVKRRLSGSK